MLPYHYMSLKSNIWQKAFTRVLKAELNRTIVAEFDNTQGIFKLRRFMSAHTAKSTKFCCDTSHRHEAVSKKSKLCGGMKKKEGLAFRALWVCVITFMRISPVLFKILQFELNLFSEQQPGQQVCRHKDVYRNKSAQEPGVTLA